MGLSTDEGVLSHVIDLVVGIVAAIIAWALFTTTGQAIWSLLLLLAVVAMMVWLRTRERGEKSDVEN
jgi:membrane protein implicated in regulation of membrane protease activity